MQKLSTILFLTAFVFIVSAAPSAAQQRFRAGLIGGLNASQILNDDVGGYNRLGIQGGLRAIAILKEKVDLNIELLYSQRGSHDKVGSPRCPNGSLDIKLNYVEVPVVITFKDWLHEEYNYYRIQVSGGLSYGRLISANAIGSCHDSETDNFSTNDYSFTTGVEYFTNEHLSLGVRWTKSFNRLYDHRDHNESLNSLRGFFLSFRGAYIF